MVEYLQAYIVLSLLSLLHLARVGSTWFALLDLDLKLPSGGRVRKRPSNSLLHDFVPMLRRGKLVACSSETVRKTGE